MRLYFKYLRDGKEVYSSHFGMAQELVIQLLEALGSSSIEVVTEEAYIQQTHSA